MCFHMVAKQMEEKSFFRSIVARQHGMPYIRQPESNPFLSDQLKQGCSISRLAAESLEYMCTGGRRQAKPKAKPVTMQQLQKQVTGKPESFEVVMEMARRSSVGQ